MDVLKGQHASIKEGCAILKCSRIHRTLSRKCCCFFMDSVE